AIVFLDCSFTESDTTRSAPTGPDVSTQRSHCATHQLCRLLNLAAYLTSAQSALNSSTTLQSTPAGHSRSVKEIMAPVVFGRGAYSTANTTPQISALNSGFPSRTTTASTGLSSFDSCAPDTHEGHPVGHGERPPLFAPSSQSGFGVGSRLVFEIPEETMTGRLQPLNGVHHPLTGGRPVSMYAAMPQVEPSISRRNAVRRASSSGRYSPSSSAKTQSNDWNLEDIDADAERYIPMPEPGDFLDPNLVRKFSFDPIRPYGGTESPNVVRTDHVEPAARPAQQRNWSVPVATLDAVPADVVPHTPAPRPSKTVGPIGDDMFSSTTGGFLNIAGPQLTRRPSKLERAKSFWRHMKNNLPFRHRREFGRAKRRTSNATDEPLIE
ncbi:hypothetical protein BDV95DRAFT_636180, partial [Massariosphaeria phaeospora]